MLLEESMAGPSPWVEGAFIELTQQLPAGSPVRARALLSLGQTRYALDDLDGARAALRECVRTGPGRAPCLQLLGRLELELGAVRNVPVRWSFDNPDHGFVHPWSYASRGTVRIDEVGGDPALAWTTTVAAQADDQLVLGFDHPDPTPEGVRFTVHATAFDAHLRLIAFDAQGRRYTRGQFIAPVGRALEVVARFRTFEGVDPNQGALDASTLHELVIQDVTGYVARSRGQNSLIIDDFEVF